jgi:hypothetical protein
MRKLVGVLLLAACGGGPSFAGTWFGQLSHSGACSDHSGGFGTLDVRWVIKEAGSTLTITPEGGACGDLTADLNGCVATLEEKVCPPLSSGASTGFSAGTFSLNGAGLLFVSLEQTGLAVNGDPCVDHAEGSLQREP